MKGSRNRELQDRQTVELKTRPARALIGWMSPQEGYIVLSLPPAPEVPIPDLAQRIWEAHSAVRSRPSGVEQSHALSDVGEEMRDYRDQFQEDPNFQDYRASGCTLKIANLNEICALQPVVHLDYLHRSNRFTELIRRARKDDMLSLAKITLPLPAPVELPLHFDPATNAWTLRSISPNIRIVGHFSTRIELSPGFFAMGYGFCVRLVPSIVQVVLYRGRYFLKDGHHRALALLERGITRVPVVVQELSRAEKLEVEGRFPDKTLLGPHPPLLSDYLRDDVAAACFNRAAEKTIAIQAAEELKWG